MSTHLKWIPLICYLISSLFTGCKPHNENKYMLFSTKGMKEVAGERIFPDVRLMSARSICVDSNRIYVTDKYEGKHLTVISLTDSTVSRWLNEGKGPAEFMRISDLFFSNEDTILTILDERTRKVCVFDMSNGFDPQSETLTRTEQLKFDANIFRIIPFKEKYIANGCFGDNQFAILNSDTEIESSFGLYPGDKTAVGSQEFFLKNQTVIKSDPSQKYFFAAGLYNDWLSFYHYENGSFKLIDEYFSIDSSIKTSSRTDKNVSSYSSRETSETIRTYRSLYVTDNYLYALYWGVPSESLVECDKCYILKFSFDGELVAGYVMDNLLNAFAVSQDDTTLYAITYSSDDECLMKYVL